jgi:UDP-N-acetylglucosamine 2-epimerase (non-hydrolysing)
VRLDSLLVHTGQHYDEKLSQVFFDELGIPRPDINLNVGSGSHAQQTAAVMAAFEPVLLERQVDLVLVVGDVNSTIACALVASKLGIPIAHVEAGLRSYDRQMPEEINRVLTDQISDLLFTTEAAAAGNLQREGVDASKIHFVGNVMIDTLLAHRDRARATAAHAALGLEPSAYGLLTLHRPSNVDDPAAFERLMGALDLISRDVPIVFPVHPRSRPVVARSATATAMEQAGRLRLVDPLGYLDFIGLMERARVVLTDSGGVQEETTILNVPCLTLRENTERPVTITHGTNQLVGTNPAKIAEAWARVKAPVAAPPGPPLWDGQAAERIADVLDRYWN